MVNYYTINLLMLHFKQTSATETNNVKMQISCWLSQGLGL